METDDYVFCMGKHKSDSSSNSDDFHIEGGQKHVCFISMVCIMLIIFCSSSSGGSHGNGNRMFETSGIWMLKGSSCLFSTPKTNIDIFHTLQSQSTDHKTHET